MWSHCNSARRFLYVAFDFRLTFSLWLPHEKKLHLLCSIVLVPFIPHFPTTFIHFYASNVCCKVSLLGKLNELTHFLCRLCRKTRSLCISAMFTFMWVKRSCHTYNKPESNFHRFPHLSTCRLPPSIHRPIYCIRHAVLIIIIAIFARIKIVPYVFLMLTFTLGLSNTH